MTGLQLSEVSKHFQAPGKGIFTALESVSLSLEPGQLGVLLGPSGCGKSTLLRMVAGLETVSSGQIKLNSNVVTGPGQDRGMVFQNYSSFPWLNVRQNVAFGLSSNGETSYLGEGVVDYFLRAMKLQDFADAYPHQLSGGMQQRVAIARTLANHPEMLLMDEPFGALDPETRWQMQALLLEIVRKEATSVLLVSHDIEEALYLGDVIFYLGSNPGRILKVIRPGFKRRSEDRDAILDEPEFRQLEREIRKMMRSDGQAA